MSFFDIFKISQFKAEIEQLRSQLSLTNQQLNDALSKLNEFGYPELAKLQRCISESEAQYSQLNESLSNLQARYNEQSALCEKLEKQNASNTKKIEKSKELIKRAKYALETYNASGVLDGILQSEINEMESISPTIMLKLHCMDVKDLKKAYRDNDKKIDALLKDYSSRYTTKANQAIYSLMVIALRAELQNILYNLKYEKLDVSIDAVKKVTQKYLKIACDGNQSIAPTLTKFIGEIEYLFINAVKIEYNYYVKREQAKQEQAAIREQMRQEAEERKALEAEKKKIAKEEEKYNNEISKLQETISSASDQDEIESLKARIMALQSQLSDVIVKKEEITNLQNGKAGTVYVISNLGSFGDNVFKIGMTRRLNPEERIAELGNASVPFKFDVHSFIFSDDAVSLESKIHDMLNNKRVNKVNLRKEFFNISIDELEELVLDIDPTAEFNKTMLAEEFRQSISSDEAYTNDYVSDFDDEDEDEEE